MVSGFLGKPGGLSPRMRGNLPVMESPGSTGWSIPAYAGEPVWQAGQARPVRVYPRVCGGTVIRLGRRLHRYGLSPRMRGNRPRHIRAGASERSIPAYAGEPVRWRAGLTIQGVYPRVCGGTISRSRVSGTGKGLSPRMRGNQPVEPGDSITGRSIPAYAGEPCLCPYLAGGCEVYPRVCGGTTRRRYVCPSDRGLSPRMRGNPLPHSATLTGKRSIPAYAGEPTGRRLRNCPPEVYPRVCGGTGIPGQQLFQVACLSPRMRGNRQINLARHGGTLSIPAYAGEPPRCWSAQ